LTVGAGENVGDLANLAIALRAIAKGGAKSMTVPIADSNGFRNGQSVVLWDQVKARRLFRTLGAR